ncbi:MAG: alpha/beta hydrolase, partial [Bacteroidota bacterium]
DAWQAGHEIFATGGSLEDNIAAIQPLMQDSLCRAMFGYKAEANMSEEARTSYKANQANYTETGRFDEKSGLWAYIPNFDELLGNFECPVLALFGEKDSQIDWRDTRALYQKNMGSNLTIKTFPQGNHILQECVTGGWKEDLSALNWRACPGYYDTMIGWLREQGFVE